MGVSTTRLVIHLFIFLFKFLAQKIPCLSNVVGIAWSPEIQLLFIAAKTTGEQGTTLDHSIYENQIVTFAKRITWITAIRQFEKFNGVEFWIMS